MRELEPRLNFPFPLGDYVTLGGLINHRLCRIPEAGDVVELEGGRLEVLKLDVHRISQIMFEDLTIAPIAIDTLAQPLIQNCQAQK